MVGAVGIELKTALTARKLFYRRGSQGKILPPPPEFAGSDTFNGIRSYTNRLRELKRVGSANRSNGARKHLGLLREFHQIRRAR